MYLRDQPNGQFAEEAKKSLAECKEKETQALVNVAHFYERRHQPAAAVVYYKMAEEAENASSETAKPAPGQPGEAPKKANP
jgi:outer membrane protein assembly factor BamD (BamD/ComL family)